MSVAVDPAAEAVLQVVGASKSYGSRRALKDVDLQLAAGEFVALLGPNGAGKTTLFQLLTGLFVADQGRILVSGYDIRHDPVLALASVGVVFQQPTLDLDLTVQANLRFHCRLHGIARQQSERRIEQELSRLELLDRAREPARSLSGGNRRKIELVRSLLHEPQVLLMDEATVGLDPASRGSLVSYVYDLCHQRRVSTLWATHLVDEAERADRVLVLHQGELVAAGTPQSLIQHTGQPDLGQAFLSLTGASSKPTEEQ